MCGLLASEAIGVLWNWKCGPSALLSMVPDAPAQAGDKPV
jgi:hypothetical protein